MILKIKILNYFSLLELLLFIFYDYKINFKFLFNYFFIKTLKYLIINF